MQYDLPTGRPPFLAGGHDEPHNRAADDDVAAAAGGLGSLRTPHTYNASGQAAQQDERPATGTALGGRGHNHIKAVCSGIFAWCMPPFGHPSHLAMTGDGLQ